MAIVTLHPAILRLRGKMGDVVFRLAHSGKMTITKIPDMSKVKWSKAQKAQRRRFKKAVAYAKSAKADPKLWAIYQEIAAKKHKRACDLAMKDYFDDYALLSKRRSTDHSSPLHQ